MGLEIMTSAVVKVSSRCNLNCTYCYMYNLEDLTFHDQTPLMSTEVCHALIRVVADHCQLHDIPVFTFVFHGGEPLLVKEAFYTDFVLTARKLIPESTRLDFAIQTNGILLNQRRCAMLKSLGIRVGISIDGPREVNDRYRVDHRGRGSYDRVRKGWDEAQKYGLNPGLLTVVDPDQDVREFYEHIRQLNPRRADVLLPDANYAHPPQHWSEHMPVYGKWLAELFRLWTEDTSSSFEVRMFNTLIETILAASPDHPGVTNRYNGIFGINPDGSLETLDLMRACETGMVATTYNVTTNTLDELFQVPIVRAFYYEKQSLCEECQRCPYLKICGGGNLPHRYSRERGLDNPSVYCRDLKYLFHEVREWIIQEAESDFDEDAELVASHAHAN
jgi:uncharacterized protein